MESPHLRARCGLCGLMALARSSWVLVRATECPSDGRLADDWSGAGPSALQLRYLEGKRVRVFRFTLARKGVGFPVGALLAFSIGSKLARFSLWVVDGAWSCCTLSTRSGPEGGSLRASRAEWGALGAFWVQSVLARRYCASGSAGGTQSAHCGQKLECWAYAV